MFDVQWSIVMWSLSGISGHVRTVKQTIGPSNLCWNSAAESPDLNRFLKLTPRKLYSIGLIDECIQAQQRIILIRNSHIVGRTRKPYFSRFNNPKMTDVEIDRCRKWPIQNTRCFLVVYGICRQLLMSKMTEGSLVGCPREGFLAITSGTVPDRS